MPHGTGSVGLPGVRNRMGYINVAAATSLEAHDCGSLVCFDSATGRTVTLPTIAQAGEGWWCQFVVTTQPTSGNHVITEDGSADTDKVIGGFNELETDTDEDGPSTTGATQANFIANVAVVGDGCIVMCDGTNWIIRGQVAADGGVTIT